MQRLNEEAIPSGVAFLAGSLPSRFHSTSALWGDIDGKACAQSSSYFSPRTIRGRITTGIPASGDGDPLGLVNLSRPMAGHRGDPSISIGIIDGPVDLTHAAFSGLSVSTVKPDQRAVCRNMRSEACSHGTAITGILGARRGSPAPAICPSCTFIFYPIFPEYQQRSGTFVSVSPSELARAIVQTVDAGAKIVNLSLGVIPSDTSALRELDEACDYAARRGVILVAAAGNQGRIGFLPLLNHPWVIPVASCDGSGTVTPESNLSPTIGKRGLLAPGVNILTTAPDGEFAPVTGTSAAAAFVTGGMALLWSESLGARALEIRTAVLRSAAQDRSIVPPLLNVEAAWKYQRIPFDAKETNMSDDNTQSEITQSHPESPVAPPEARPAARAPAIGANPPPRRRVVSQIDGESCPTCASGAQNSAGPPAFVYAIGMVRTRFPSPSIEKEFAQAIAAGPEKMANLTDQTVLYNALKENRYLANEVCWNFTVENVETYILAPREPAVLDQLVEAVKPSQRGIDTDVIVGVRGPIASPEMCNGLVVPIVVVDRIYSFDRPELLKAIKKPKEVKMTDEQWPRSADELFDRIQQMADNVGGTDEHRAVNYLAVRYPQIYTHTAEMSRESSLTAVDVAPSRLSGNRKLVNVVFSYTNRSTDVVEKYYVRVDVTEKYPYLDKKLSPFYERE